MYPPGIVTRTCTVVGGSVVLESGDDLVYNATIESDRGLVWTGSALPVWLPAVDETKTGTGSQVLSFPVPVSDQPGYQTEDGFIIDVSEPGTHTHTYTMTIEAVRDGRQVGEITTPAFVLPTGDLSPVNVLQLIEADTVPGLLVSMPDAWGGMVAAAEAAAVAAATTAEAAALDYFAANPVPPGSDGDDGREVELQTTATHVQWRYVGDAAWTDLVSLAAITGDDGLSVELQTTATHIQWRLVGGAWADLVALSALVGPAGPPNSLAIGTVTTLAAGSSATASVTGASPSQTLNLGIPRGETGATGGVTSVDGQTGAVSLSSTYAPRNSTTTITLADAAQAIDMPATPQTGDVLTLIITAAGGTPSWPADVWWDDVPTLSTTAGVVDVITLLYAQGVWYGFVSGLGYRSRVLLTDSFTGTNGVRLIDHAPDYSIGAWAADSTNATMTSATTPLTPFINTNRATSTSGAAAAARVPVAQAEMVATIDYDVTGGTGTNDRINLAVVADTATSGLVASVRQNRFAIFLDGVEVHSTLATYTTGTVELGYDGTEGWCSLNSVEVWRAAMTGRTAAYVGLGIGAGAYRYADNLRVVIP